MSTGTTKRTWQEALRDAELFRGLFETPTVWEQWAIAGSVRRKKPEVGDVEHVVVPAFEARPGGGLYGQTVDDPRNLLLARRDELLEAKRVEQAIYPDGRPRWGPKLFGCWFKGFRHEVFVVEPECFGNQLLIRTGPQEFSQRYVTSLQKHGYVHRDGCVVKCVRTEEEAFALIGRPLPRPEDRK